MNDSFRLGSDGVCHCVPFEQFEWQRHGFGTRQANPHADITLRQVHSDCVWNADGFEDREQKGDGLITNKIGKCIGIRTADCVPILLLDCQKRAIGAVHAGWRGTAAEVVKRAIQKMSAEFDTAPADVYAAIGPCIRGCCYEVGANVAAHFGPLFPEWEPADNKRKLDLAEANRRQMLAAGLDAERVFDCGLCTMCQHTQFFSYRRDPEDHGRMIASICRLA